MAAKHGEDPARVVDPVCGTDLREALCDELLPRPMTLTRGQDTYLFCSDLCRREFETYPERYRPLRPPDRATPAA